MIKVSFSVLSLMKTQLDHSRRVGPYSTQWFTKVQDWPRLHTHSHHCRQCTRKSPLHGVPADKAEIVYNIDTYDGDILSYNSKITHADRSLQIWRWARQRHAFDTGYWYAWYGKRFWYHVFWHTVKDSDAMYFDNQFSVWIMSSPLHLPFTLNHSMIHWTLWKLGWWLLIQVSELFSLFSLSFLCRYGFTRQVHTVLLFLNMWDWEII